MHIRCRFNAHFSWKIQVKNYIIVYDMYHSISVCNRILMNSGTSRVNSLLPSYICQRTLISPSYQCVYIWFGYKNSPSFHMFQHFLKYICTGWSKKKLWCDLEEKCLINSKIFFDGVFLSLYSHLLKKLKFKTDCSMF